VKGSNFTYAIGKLVLWSAQPGYVNDQGAVLAAGKTWVPPCDTSDAGPSFH